MRGKAEAQPEFLTIINLHQRVPADHPLRGIKERVGKVLARLSPLTPSVTVRTIGDCLPCSFPKGGVVLGLEILIKKARMAWSAMAQVHHTVPEQGVHGFVSREVKPALTIDPGDTVVFQTLDSGWGGS